MSIELTLIGRAGCHLCEVAQGDLAQVISRFAHEYPRVEYSIDDIDIATTLTPDQVTKALKAAGLKAIHRSLQRAGALDRFPKVQFFKTKERG